LFGFMLFLGFLFQDRFIFFILFRAQFFQFIVQLRCVIDCSLQFIRQILLRHDMIRIVMGVFIGLFVVLGGVVDQMRGHFWCFASPHILDGGVHGQMGGI